MVKLSGGIVTQSQKVAGKLRQAIVSGRLAPGDRLDSIRILAERFGVGRQVVLSAFEMLAKERLLVSRVGSGSFVNPDFRLPAKIYRLGFYPHRSSILSRHSGQVFEYCCRYAGELKHDILLRPYRVNMEPSQLFDLLDGLLVSGEVDDELVEALNNAGKPFVVIGNFELTQPASMVVMDGEKERVERLLETALEKFEIHSIGILLGSPRYLSTRIQEKGIHEFAGKHGLLLEPGAVISQECEDGYLEMKALLKKGIAVPDLLYMTANAYPGVETFFHEHPEIPRPVLVASERYGQELENPPPRTILSTGQAGAKEAVDLLFELLNGKATGPVVRKYDPDMTIRVFE